MRPCTQQLSHRCYCRLCFRLGPAEAELVPVGVGTLDGDEIDELDLLLGGDLEHLTQQPSAHPDTLDLHRDVVNMKAGGRCRQFELGDVERQGHAFEPQVAETVSHE